MKKNIWKKISGFTRAFLVLAFAFLLVGVGTLGSTQTTGEAYELMQGSADEEDANVIFKLSDLTENGTTTYLRLSNIYINVAAIYSETGTAATVRFYRASSATSWSTLSTYYYGASLTNFVAGDSSSETTNALGNWIAPFDFSSDTANYPSRLIIKDYDYWKLVSFDCNLLINEVVFVGEKLTKSGGDGTGEYCVIPATVYSATIVENESTAEATVRAGALLDKQKMPSLAQSSFFALGGDEAYSMITIAEMRMGSVYYLDSGGDLADTYHADGVYNSLGTSILALGVAIFGNSPFGLRFFPMLAAFGVLVVVFLLTKELLKSDKAGFIFSLLYALSGMALGLAHLGTPLMIGVFFFACSLYFCWHFYNRGLKAASLKGALGLVLSGLFGAAAISVNGAYVIALAGVVALFAAGMVRQNRARRFELDGAIAAYEAEAEALASAPAPESGEEPEAEPAPVSESKKKVAAVAAEYGRKNLIAPVAFFASLLFGTLIFSLLFLLPVYNVYVKVYDNPASPKLSVFALMGRLFAGGFTGSNPYTGQSSAWSIFYTAYAGSGTLYAVTGIMMNAVAMLAGLAGIVYAVYRIMLVVRGELSGREKRIALRRTVGPLAGLVLSLVTASFGGGALAFILLAYVFAFILAADCAVSLTKESAPHSGAARVAVTVGIVCLALCFALFAVFTFSIPLPSGFMSKLFG